MVGFLGQALFSARFLDPVDHVRAGEAVGDAGRPSGISRWRGGVVLLAYAIYRRDPVFMLGQGDGAHRLCPQPLADPCRQAAGLSARHLRALGLAGIASSPSGGWRCCRSTAPISTSTTRNTGSGASELDWGYYSKPPLIAWIIRLSTAIGGSEDALLDPAAVAADPRRHRGRGGAGRAAALRRARRAASPALPSSACPRSPWRAFSLSTDTPMLSASRWRCWRNSHLAERRSVGWALTPRRGDRRRAAGQVRDDLLPALRRARRARCCPRRASPGATSLIAAVAGARASSRRTSSGTSTNQFATLHHTADNTRLGRAPASTPGELFELLGPASSCRRARSSSPPTSSASPACARPPRRDTLR